MTLPERFIVIDDDRSNNIICEFSLRRFSPVTEIKTFLDPQVALEFIKESYSQISLKSPTILFLDINMPVITGWEFLEIFKVFEPYIKQQFIIYLLTSSIDHRDIEKAKANVLVHGVLPKPLSSKIINSVFKQNLDVTILPNLHLF